MKICINISVQAPTILEVLTRKSQLVLQNSLLPKDCRRNENRNCRIKEKAACLCVNSAAVVNEVIIDFIQSRGAENELLCFDFPVKRVSAKQTISRLH